MIAYSKTTEERGYTLSTTVKLGTIQGRAERIYREAEMRYQPTQREIIGGLVFFACLALGGMLAMYGVYVAIEKVLRGLGL